MLSEILFYVKSTGLRIKILIYNIYVMSLIVYLINSRGMSYVENKNNK